MHYLAREDLAIVNGRLNHAVANAILDTGARLHDLQLAGHTRHIAFCHPVQVDHRRAACSRAALIIDQLVDGEPD